MQGKDGDKQLRRIIAMLLALATLAERAGGACWPVRCLVLWILRRGEAAAVGYVREVAQAPLGVIDLSDFPDDNSPAGALCLAMRFTALAAALGLLLRQPRPFARGARQTYVAGAQPVMRHLYEGSPVGLPGSRAPPPHLREAGRRYSGAETAVRSALARPASAVAPSEVHNSL